MKPNARTATAADFEAAAQSWANSTWLSGLVAAVVGYFAGWFALIPGVFALLSIVHSVAATSMAGRLRAGTYTIPTPNNGVAVEPTPAAINKTKPMASPACNAPQSRSLYGTPNTQSPANILVTQTVPATARANPQARSLYGNARTRKISPAALRNDDR